MKTSKTKPKTAKRYQNKFTFAQEPWEKAAQAFRQMPRSQQIKFRNFLRDFENI